MAWALGLGLPWPTAAWSPAQLAHGHQVMATVAEGADGPAGGGGMSAQEIRGSCSGLPPVVPSLVALLRFSPVTRVRHAAGGRGGVECRLSDGCAKIDKRRVVLDDARWAARSIGGLDCISGWSMGLGMCKYALFWICTTW